MYSRSTVEAVTVTWKMGNWYTSMQILVCIEISMQRSYMHCVHKYPLYFCFV